MDKEFETYDDFPFEGASDDLGVSNESFDDSDDSFEDSNFGDESEFEDFPSELDDDEFEDLEM